MILNFKKGNNKLYEWCIQFYIKIIGLKSNFFLGRFNKGYFGYILNPIGIINVIWQLT